MTASLKTFPLHLIFLLCGLHAHAQQYSFRNYTVADGLGSASVNHIFQDSKGYLWFATQGGGVSRFNGKEFKNFTKADGLINNDVTYIAEDSEGALWIATATGASQFDGITFRNYAHREGLTNGVVYAIYPDEKNKVWFATRDEGIKIFDGKNFDSLTVSNGLPSNEVYCIEKDKAGSLWFGFSNGLAKFDGNKITAYRDSALVSGKTFFSALADARGNLWFGSIGSGALVIRPDGAMQNLTLPAPVQNDFIGGIAEDRSGNFWFATDHGLLKYDGNRFRLFSEHEGLSVNTAQAVLCDYEGNIWSGTLGGGVNALSSEAFTYYTRKDGLAGRSVTCIAADRSGKLYYIGTSSGLLVFNTDSKPTFRKISSIGEIAQANISSLSLDKRGLLWLCAQEGVFVLEKQNTDFRLRKKYERIAGEHVVSPTKVIHDSGGNCWLATFGSGIFFISRQGEEKSYSTKNGFPSDNVLTLFEDSRGNVLAGTHDAGILKFDGKIFQPLRVHADSEPQSVWTIAEDNNGNIYWGTSESGLFRSDGKTIRFFGSRDGIPSGTITSLAWDKDNNFLWLGSDKGLIKMTFTTEGNIASLNAYDTPDGFIQTGINQDAILIAGNESLLGTANGLWVYNSEFDLPKNIPPKIQLTGIRLFYQAADWKKFSDSLSPQTLLPAKLQLPYNKNHLTFDIQALTTREALYVFKMNGMDEEWSSPTKNNEITYTNIQPGEYEFQAKAISKSGITSGLTSFSFTVNPPWWNTWWFRLAAILAAAGSLLAVVSAREKALKEQTLKLEETVKLRTLEIARQKEVVERTLTEKEGLLHEKEILLKEIHHRVKNNLQTISSMLMLQSAGLKDEQAKKAITESQSRVRSIALVHQKLYQTEGLEKVEVSAFVKDLTEQVKSFYRHREKEVEITLNIPETFMLIDTAIPLGLILNELLTNSFKYAFTASATGEIHLALEHLAGGNPSGEKLPLHKKVKLTYRDSGSGLKSAEILENATTLGLRLIQLLSRQIGATLSYSSAHGSEFIFTFELHA